MLETNFNGHGIHGKHGKIYKQQNQRTLKTLLKKSHEFNKIVINELVNVF